MTPKNPKKKLTLTDRAEFRERCVRLYREHRRDYTSDNAGYRAICSKLGCSHRSHRAWCLEAARHTGEHTGLATTARTRLKELERENWELRTANEILKKALADFAKVCVSACKFDPIRGLIGVQF